MRYISFNSNKFNLINFLELRRTAIEQINSLGKVDEKIDFALSLGDPDLQIKRKEKLLDQDEMKKRELRRNVLDMLEAQNVKDKKE